MKILAQIVLSILTLLLQCCNNNENPTTFATNANSKQYDSSTPISILSNSIIKTQYTDSVYPICFEAVYRDSTFVKEITTQGESVYTFETINIGTIKIESGEIIACDPSFMQDGKPFTNKFPLGNFDVQLAIAKIPFNNNRVAFSRIKFSDNPVSKWIYATRDHEKQIPINDSTLYAFSVDGGLAAYIDKTGLEIFNNYDIQEWQRVFVKGMYQNEKTYGYIHNFESHNLATFSTGYGDGSYGSYLGLDSKGEICRLISDLGILMWWKK